MAMQRTLFLVAALGASVSAEDIFPAFITTPALDGDSVLGLCERLDDTDAAVIFLGPKDPLCDADGSALPIPGCPTLAPENLEALGLTSIAVGNSTHFVEVSLGGVSIMPETVVPEKPEELLELLSVVASWDDDLGAVIADKIVWLVVKLVKCSKTGGDDDACEAFGDVPPTTDDVPIEFIFFKLLDLLGEELGDARWYGKKDGLECTPKDLCVAGIPDRAGVACCAASCGVCGSCGCGMLPGGADLCCPNAIVANDIRCFIASDVGCILAEPGAVMPSLVQGPGCP